MRVRRTAEPRFLSRLVVSLEMQSGPTGQKKKKRSQHSPDKQGVVWVRGVDNHAAAKIGDLGKNTFQVVGASSCA